MSGEDPEFSGSWEFFDGMAVNYWFGKVMSYFLCKKGTNLT